MTAKETQAYIKQIKMFAKKISASKAKSVKFLAKTGVYTKKGALNPQYK
jgi:hypothetical protein